MGDNVSLEGKAHSRAAFPEAHRECRSYIFHLGIYRIRSGIDSAISDHYNENRIKEVLHYENDHEIK